MQIYLGLGSNVGDRRAQLTAAIDALTDSGVSIDRVSPVVESPAMLPDDAPAEWNRPFLNLALECRDDRAPHDVLDLIKRVERDLGRVDRGRWAPRPIDIDILLWGDEQIATERVQIPHPGIADRAFVLAPLAALRPRLRIPGISGATVLDLARRLRQRIPLWMGIVNLTPDSFSDGGELPTWESVEARIDEMVAAGVHLIDIGAESTRPGASPLTAEEEWARLEPILARTLSKQSAVRLRPLLSVDTYHVATARRALALGVDVINDVSGLTSPAMIELVGASGKEWIAMHNVSVPADPKKTLPLDQDPRFEVERWLEERLAQWQRAGLDLERIVFDPGVGFGKNPLQSLRLLRDIGSFATHGLRLLVGHSRKSFMTSFAGDHTDRDLATIGASLALCAQGVDILRVHNLPAHVAAYRGWAHVLTG
jgi:2-amino-4-hydroxy-6-hydroxymethyldihydropteridine diphosphokinase/dihydropteroate synthase